MELLFSNFYFHHIRNSIYFDKNNRQKRRATAFRKLSDSSSALKVDLCSTTGASASFSSCVFFFFLIDSCKSEGHINICHLVSKTLPALLMSILSGPSESFVFNLKYMSFFQLGPHLLGLKSELNDNLS